MCPALNDNNNLVAIKKSSADEPRAYSIAVSDDGVAQQPCSGVRLIQSAAFGSGASAASPEYVCVIKHAV